MPTDDDLAREIAERVWQTWKNPKPWPRSWPDDPEAHELITTLMVVAATEAVAAERERCARIAESYDTWEGDNIAILIRGGQTDGVN